MSFDWISGTVSLAWLTAGYFSICVNILELCSRMPLLHGNTMRAIEQQIAMAHRHGLKVLLIPSRFAGRLAGAPFMSSPFICAHPEWALPGYPGCGCLDVPEVVEASVKFIELIVKNFEIDGLILDEPKEAETPSSHPATVARYGHPGTAEDARASMLGYLRTLIAAAKLLKAQQKISLAHNRALVGTEQKILIDSVQGTEAVGRTLLDAPDIDNVVHVSSRKKLKPGERVMVRIERAAEYELEGSQVRKELS